MCKDLVKTGDAQAKRRDRELDLWQVVLDQDPHLRLPVDMKWDLQQREQRRRAERKAAKKKAAKAREPDSGQKGSEGERESASDDESPIVKREKKGEECEPAWTHLTRPDTLPCGSVLTRFARAVWLHAPRTSAPELFWSTLRRQIIGFSDDMGWWPHVFWQELYGRWCQSMVVVAPTIAHQAVLLHRHIRFRRDFEAPDDSLFDDVVNAINVFRRSCVCSCFRNKLAEN